MSRDWPHDIEQLRDIARDEIIPRWKEDDDRDPTRDWPTHQWLIDNGYSHLRYILEQNHNMSVPDFFRFVVPHDDEDSAKWAVDDGRTVKEAEKFLGWGSKYREWRSTTRENVYYLLNRVFEEYSQCAEQHDLVDIAEDPDRWTAAYDSFVEATHRIRSDSASDESAYQYLRAIQRFYEWLNRRHVVRTNIVEGLEKEFDWDRSYDGSEPLLPAQIAQLWEAAETLEEYLVTIGYIMWGVRRKELPSVRKSQFKIEEGKLQIEFEDDQRKTGAATVTVLIGEQYVRERFERISGEDGYLLPDQDNPREPMSQSDAADLFTELCEKAEVTVEDETPTPNNGRATWHDLNARAGAVLEEIAKEYGTLQEYDDVDSMIGYQGLETRDEMRQMLFIQTLEEYLPDEAFSENLVFLNDAQGQYALDQFESDG